MLHEKPIRIKDVDAAAWRCPRSGTFACNPVLLSKRIQSGKVLGQTVIMRSDHTSKGIRESEASAQVEHFWTLWSNASASDNTGGYKKRMNRWFRTRC